MQGKDIPGKDLAHFPLVGDEPIKIDLTVSVEQ